MSKVLESPFENFSGKVILPDRLTLPQCGEIDKAFGDPNEKNSQRVWKSVLDIQVLPALLACVEKWEIKDFPEQLTAQNFPATPRKESHDFIMWVWEEIKKIYYGEKKVPNE